MPDFGKFVANLILILRPPKPLQASAGLVHAVEQAAKSKVLAAKQAQRKMPDFGKFVAYLIMILGPPKPLQASAGLDHAVEQAATSKVLAAKQAHFKATHWVACRNRLKPNLNINHLQVFLKTVTWSGTARNRLTPAQYMALTDIIVLLERTRDLIADDLNHFTYPPVMFTPS